MTEQDALAEAKEGLKSVRDMINNTPETKAAAEVALISAGYKLQFAQTAALIAIAEALTKDGKSNT